MLQLHALAAADADHLQVSDNITLAGTGGLEIQAADHLHLAETAPLTQVHALGVDAGDHLHIADTVNLSGAYTLENLDADHLQTAGAPILGQTYILAAAEAAHIQAVATIELTTISALIVAEAAHDQLADTLELTQVLPNQLNAAACDHLVVSDPLVLSQLYALAVDDIDHDQLADAIGIIVTLATADTDQTLADDGPLSLAMGWRLSMASAVHLHTAASIGLGQAHLLAIQPNLIQLVSDTTRATPNATMGQVFQTDYRSFTTSYSLKSLSPQFDFNSLTRRSSMSGLVQGAIQ